MECAITLVSGKATVTFTVQIESSGKSFAVAGGETVLDAALREGLSLPFGCRTGACRSCKGRILEGTVSYPDALPKALQRSDVDQGFALFCKARATSNLIIDIEEIDPSVDIIVREVPCRLIAKEQLNHDVMRLKLQLPEGERLHYLAGQYVDIVMRDGRRRAFSLANAPGHDDYLELQIRHVPDGSFSGYVFSHLKERSLLRVFGPLGSFYLRKDRDAPIVFLAGGTGFAPIKSIIEGALRSGFQAPMHLYWGVRAREDLYLDELATEWAEAHKNLSYTPVLSESDPTDSWSGRTGFVHQVVLEDLPDLTGHVVYLSGPPPMVNAGRRTFVNAGVDPLDVHSDSFDYAYETGHDR